MSRAGLIAGCLVCLGFLALPTRADDKLRKPNVVFIMADDLNNDLGCYGNKLVQSPGIDRLAARGMRFDRAYCNYPVCNPSRTELLSGRRATSTRVVDNLTPGRSNPLLKDAVMLPQHFRANGYTTLKVGKIFHTGAKFEDPPSWDKDIRETAESKTPPKDQILSRTEFADFKSNRERVGIVLKADDADAWDGKVARQGVQLLEEHAKGEKPFFLAVGFRRPHTPYIAPKKYFDLYPPDKMTPRVEPREHLKNIPSIALAYNKDSVIPDEAGWRLVHQAYYASVSYMDAQVGVLLDAVERLRLWDNTIVVFVSDHGYHLGEHGGLWHKMTLFEEAARIPMIVAAPGKKPGVSSRLVEIVDLYPTLAELARLPVDKDLEGTSFVPLLDQPDKPWKKAAFTVVSRGGGVQATQPLDPNKISISARTERYRYTVWHDGSKELYDHDNDPKEHQNLAGKPEYAAIEVLMDDLHQRGWKDAMPVK